MAIIEFVDETGNVMKIIKAVNTNATSPQNDERTFIARDVTADDATDSNQQHNDDSAATTITVNVGNYSMPNQYISSYGWYMGKDKQFEIRGGPSFISLKLNGNIVKFINEQTRFNPLEVVEL